MEAPILFLAGFLTLASSCSLSYSSQAQDESRVPEFTFRDASFNRYEDNERTFSLEATRMEQYSAYPVTYAQDAEFKVWNEKDEVETEGSCGLLGMHSDGQHFTLFRDIFIKNYEQQMEIHADKLKWNAENGQIVSDTLSTVELIKDNLAIKGTGFSADSKTHDFKFSTSADGSIESDDTAEGESK